MPNLFPIVSSQDGPQLTVNDILKDPAVVPRRILDVTAQRFIADQLLRKGPTAVAGVVKYYQSNPLFSMTPTEIVAEFGQIPVAQNDLGQLFVAQTTKRGLGVRISIEMANRNDIDAVNLQIAQVSNTMVRDWDSVFMSAALAACAASGNTVAASTYWSESSATPRKDILTAAYEIVSSVLPGTTDNYLGYTPDTLVFNVADVVGLAANDDAWKAWVGNVADQSTAVTGKLPNNLWGYDVWQTFHIPIGTALLLQRNVAGFISDERPLQATPLRWVEDEEYYRSNAIRQSAIGIDQPLAMCTITGISDGEAP
jgi:hypothetical protein